MSLFFKILASQVLLAENYNLNAYRFEWDRYDYIAFLDTDNYLHKNYLQEVNSQLEAHSNLIRYSFIGCEVETIHR